ncbi:MAG: hypothetical protein R2849_05740 [Thermomicrobiales bacterium]
MGRRHDSLFRGCRRIDRESDVRMAPRSMQYIYTPNNVDEAGFVGSAMIESNQPVAAAIDEVKYSTVEATCYLASSVGQVDAAIPVTFREDPLTGVTTIQESISRI